MHGPRNPWQSCAQTQGQSQHKNGNQPIMGEVVLHTEKSPHKNALLLFISSASPLIFLILDWSQWLKFWWIKLLFSLLNGDRHQLFKYRFSFCHIFAEAAWLNEFLLLTWWFFFTKLYENVLIRYSERFKKEFASFSKWRRKKAKMRIWCDVDTCDSVSIDWS